MYVVIQIHPFASVFFAVIYIFHYLVTYALNITYGLMAIMWFLMRVNRIP